MSSLLDSPRFVRRATYVAALILVAGVVAVAISFFGNTAGAVESSPPGDAEVVPTETVEPTVPVPNEARQAAGEFILSAVAREDLEKSWDLVAPELKQGYTKEEWLRGDIPIQPYPADSIETASFAVDESTANRVVLQVALLPKDGSDVEGQIFFIGLQRGADDRWLVDYWAPRAIIPVPATGEN